MILGWWWASLKREDMPAISIFGSPLNELSSYQLPTRGQVARRFLFLKHGNYISNKEVLHYVESPLVDLWNHASIPTQPLKNIKLRLNYLIEEGSQASKWGRSAVRTAKFLESLDKLFGIAFCQCQDFSTCWCDKQWKFHDANNHFWKTSEQPERWTRRQVEADKGE